MSILLRLLLIYFLFSFFYKVMLFLKRFIRGSPDVYGRNSVRDKKYQKAEHERANHSYKYKEIVEAEFEEIK